MAETRTQAIAKATHVYIGTKACGCRVAVVVDDGSRECAKDVADFIRRGYTVSRESLEDYHRAPQLGCKHPKPAPVSLFA